jgi:tight adherence protein B
MGIAVLAFIVMTAAILGGCVAAVHLPGYLAGRKLEQRLRDASGLAAIESDGDSTVLKQKQSSALPALDRMVSGSKVGGSVSRIIEQSGIQTSPGTVVVMSIGFGVIGALVCNMFVKQALAIPVAAAAGLAAPTAYLLHKRGRRLRKFEEQFPEALDLLSRAIRAGHAFQTAMGMVADELQEPVGPEFKKTFDQQNFGLPLRDALNELSQRITLLDVRFFVTAVLIQRDTGGNLAEVLDNLAHVVRERFKIMRQVRVHTAHGRFTGYVLLALPAALAVALNIENPEAMELLFKEHMGQMMILGAIVMQTVGFFWIRKVIKIEV